MCPPPCHVLTLDLLADTQPETQFNQGILNILFYDSKGLLQTQAFDQVSIFIWQNDLALTHSHPLCASFTRQASDTIKHYQVVFRHHPQQIQIIGRKIPPTQVPTAVIPLSSPTPVVFNSMEMIGGLAAGIAHEVNNPLSTIVQGVQNILRRLDPTRPYNLQIAHQAGIDLAQVDRYLNLREITRFLNSIHLASMRASRIVTDMLSFARRNALVRVPISSRHCIENAVQLITTDYALMSEYDLKRLNINCIIAPTLPQLYCEPNAIEQVLVNILRNAAQVTLGQTQAPQITLHAFAEQNQAVIHITDNGPGLSSELLRRIFEPFYTAHTTRKGIGLGLAVSYFIVVDQHQGQLFAENVSPVGCRFTIKLPLRESSPVI